MDNELKTIAACIRGLSSQEAASWLMESYPVDALDYGNAIALLTHRSWKRADQVRLANYYLKKLPFASSRVYEAFASFMSIDLLIKILNEHLPKSSAEMSLLVYYVGPVLEKSVRTETDRELVRSFISELR